MPATDLGLADREVRRIELQNLLLDSENPRFGRKAASSSQADVLDAIVRLDVKDVLSSLAVNGYFEAEPLVCRSQPNSIKHVVAEGNRRLAACLIIKSDPRASRHAQLSRRYADLWQEHGHLPIDPVPAIVFDAGEQQEKAILSYLGVRHIASAQPWDSYAKAAWVAKIVETSELSTREVAVMIGDQHRTINRMLEGYYLVHQLIQGGQFIPENSARRGRGSVTDYPFSWVYTMLGYSAIRTLLDLGTEDAHELPIAEDHLDEAGLMLRTMFGDKAKGRNAAISDSRELGHLASALANPEKARLLERGRTLDEIDLLTQPIEKRLRDGLASVREELNSLLRRIDEDEGELNAAIAHTLTPASGRNRRLARNLDRRLNDIASETDDDDDDE